LRFLAFAFEGIAALGQGVLIGFASFDLRGFGVNLIRQCGDFLVEARLLGIHARHATGEDHAQPST
jgi:hypothetical protein